MSGKRARIIAAALQLFCERGFQQTSTANISRQAGVATGTLFLYFKSKDELINALYLETKSALAAYLRQDLPEQAAFETKLRHIWQRYIAWAQDKPYHFRFLAMFSHSPFISHLTREEAGPAFQFTQDLVEQAIREGRITAVDSRLFFALFSGQMNATIRYLMDNSKAADRPALIEQAFRIFWKGITAS